MNDPIVIVGAARTPMGAGASPFEARRFRAEHLRVRKDHFVFSKISRPISMRRISLVPAPISYSLASRNRRPVG